MATFTKDMNVKFVTTKDGDEEEVAFKQGDEVAVVHTWQRHYLVRDNDGHYHNIPKDALSN